MSSQRLLASRRSTTQQHVVTSGRPHAVLLSGAVLIVVLIAALLSLSGCRKSRLSTSDAVGDTIPLRYAQNLTMVRYSDGILVELKDPWHEGRILHRYWLTEDSNSKPSTHHISLSSLLSPLSSFHYKISFAAQRGVQHRSCLFDWHVECN